METPKRRLIISAFTRHWPDTKNLLPTLLNGLVKHYQRLTWQMSGAYWIKYRDRLTGASITYTDIVRKNCNRSYPLKLELCTLNWRRFAHWRWHKHTSACVKFQHVSAQIQLTDRDMPLHVRRPFWCLYIVSAQWPRDTQPTAWI